MSKKRFVPLAVAVALVARVRGDVRRHQYGSHQYGSSADSQRSGSCPTSGGSTTGRSTSPHSKGCAARSGCSRSRAAQSVPGRERLHRQPLEPRASGLQPDDRRRVPALGRGQHRRAAVPDPPVRDHRLLGQGPAVHGRVEERRDPEERPRPDVQHEREQLHDRLPRGADGAAQAATRSAPWAASRSRR